jgi:putative component of toxin-antitoxin plasmid stabilization module
MTLSVREYETTDGKVPFREWLATLDRTVRARVQARVLRFETGNLGDHKSVGGGVQEARVMFWRRLPHLLRPGRGVARAAPCRRYEGHAAKDIRRAQDFWRDYLEEK